MILGELIQKLGFSVDSSGLEHMHEKLEGISRSVRVLAGIEIAKGLFELAERYAGLGEHLESLSISAGISTTELQKLQFAASQNAVSGDALSGALARLNRQLYSAKNGGKQANAIFAKLGIGPEQVASFRNSSDALAAIQDAMVGVTDANERQAIAMQLFGRSGSGMIKFLTVGSKRTAELGESAEKMGAVVSEDGVKALAEFEDATSGLMQVVKSFMATVGAQLAPAFVEMVHSIEKSWAENLPMIQRNIRTFAIKAAYYLGFTTESIRLLVKLVTAFAEDHPGLLVFIAKWGPGVMVAISAFDLLTESLGKVVKRWQAVDKYAGIGFKTLLWGFGKLQVLSAYAFEGLAQFFGLFSPQLAIGIRAVGLALAGLTPIQFTLLVAGIAALVIAAHDIYEYFFNDVPYEKLWIARLLKKLEPITSRISWLMKGLNNMLTIGGGDVPLSATVSGDEAAASYRRGPMSSAAASLPDLFGGAKQMGVKFRPDDPTNAAPVKTSVMLNAPISITVPPGMSTPESIRVVREGVHQTLLEMLGDAHDHLQPAAAR